MSQGSMSTLEAFQKALEVYSFERSEAKGDPSKLATADRRLYEALKNAKVSDKVIDSFASFVASMPEKEQEMISAMIEATKGRINHVQSLQRDQASMLMSMNAKPEQAKAGIASFATTVSTILRYFGANDWADSIDQTSREIMSTINVPLNTTGITNANDEIQGLMGRVAGTYKNSNVMDRAANKAKIVPNDYAVPGDALNSGTSGAPKQKLSWNDYESAFREIGLTSSEIEKVKAPWKKYSAMSPNGERDVLNNGAEITTFMSSKEVRELDATKFKKVELAVRELALEPH